MEVQYGGEELTTDALMEIIRTQTEVVQQGLDLGGVISLVATRAMHITKADGAVVELAESGEMVYRAAAGIAEKQLGLRLKINTSLSGKCISAGCPLVCMDSESDERVDKTACRVVGLRSMIVVPLNHGDNIVGVMKVLSTEPDFFSSRDVKILELMSELIAAAMFNAAKYETNEIFHQATHDILTGLANRALFFDRMRMRIIQAKRSSECFGVLFLDMDGLKQINDCFGHRAGDAAIMELGSRIREASRQSDTVARIGGDEFAVMLSTIDKKDDLHIASYRIDKNISMPFIFEE